MRALLLSVVVCACGGTAHGASVSFRVETPTRTADGMDIDDAAPSVFVWLGDRSVSAGTAMGSCATPERTQARLVRDTCRANAPAGTLATLTCGGDPHVDAFACIYAVRTRNALELWGQDVAFTVSDEAPIHLEPRPLARIAITPLVAGVRVDVAGVEYRNTVR